MTMRHIYYGTGKSGTEDTLFCQAFDAETGDIGDLTAVASGPSTGFQTVNADCSILYSICQNADGKGGVRSYRVDGASGALNLIGEQFAVGGKPCHVSLDRSEKFLLVASYSDAFITVFPLGEDGEIKPYSFTQQHQGGSGVNAARQEDAHAHSIYADPSNRYVFVNDLGKDQVVVYRFDSDAGTLEELRELTVDTAPGAGPRHLAFHPNGRWAYVINELNGTVTHYDWDCEKGALSEQGTVDTLPAEFKGENLTAEIVVSQDGRFVYGSNRGHDSIVVYSIDQDDGSLSLVQRESVGGEHPRNFNIDPSGGFLVAANRDTDNAVFFRIYKDSGKIEATGVEVTVPKPICVRFV